MPNSEAVSRKSAELAPNLVSDRVHDVGHAPASARAAVMLAHPTLAVALSADGRIRAHNAAWGALFALPDDVSVETHVASLFPSTSAAERFESQLQGALTASSERSGTGAAVEHKLVRRGGEAFAAEIVVWLADGADAERPLAAEAIWQVRDVTDERATKRALRDLEEYHAELGRYEWDVTFVIDRKGRISYASPSLEVALGYRVSSLLGEPFTKLLAPEQAAAAGQWLRSITSAKREESARDGYRLHVLDHDGVSRVFACRPRYCFDVPRIEGMVVHARDVSDEDVAAHGAERSVAASRVEDTARPALLRAKLAALGEIAGCDVAALVDALRDALGAHVAGFRPADARTATTSGDVGAAGWPTGAGPSAHGWQAIDDVATDSAVDDERRRAYAAIGVAAAIEVDARRDGTSRGRLFVGASRPRSWSDAEIDFVVALALLAAVADASQVRPTQTEARDALTGLPDRAAARAWLERRSIEKGGSALTLLSLDLDRLQDVNDRHGHAAGDAVIARCAGVIAEAIGSGGYVARVGGDAFVVVLTNASPKAVDQTVALLLARIGAVEDGLPRVEASIGIARYPADAADVVALWLHADLAMREAKKRGRGQAFVFDPRLAQAVHVRRALGDEITEALAKDQFTLLYQPQVALATGRVVGLEALLRWAHPSRGMLAPNAFIDAAEESGLIEPITKSVVGKVCEQIATWRRAAGFPDVPVSVNVEGKQFHDRRLPALVASALLRTGLPARLLMLELGEQTLVGDAAETERVVKELSLLGIRTAVGGFALGHGALKQLRQLRVAQIKIDRGFVGGLTSDAASAAVVGAMIDIARRLKCEIVAEGVETREQFEQLRALGCEAGQGFYFGPPLAPDDARAFVEENQKHPVR